MRTAVAVVTLAALTSTVGADDQQDDKKKDDVKVTILDPSKPANAPCLGDAMTLLEKAHPEAHRFFSNQPEMVKRIFAQSLSCDRPAQGYGLGTAVHEGTHAASTHLYATRISQQVLVQVGGPSISVDKVPMTARGVLLPYLAKADDDMYTETYMHAKAKANPISMLDETNAYAQGLVTEIRVLALQPASFARTSARDGLLRFLELDMLYLKALEDPAAPEASDGGFPGRGDVTKAQTLALLETVDGSQRLAFREILARAHRALLASCDLLPEDRQREAGVRDDGYAKRLLAQRATIEKWFPDAARFLADLERGFGCKHLVQSRGKQTSRTTPG